MSVAHTLPVAQRGRALSPHCPGQGQEQGGGSGATRIWGCSSGTEAGQGCECVGCRLGCIWGSAHMSCNFVHPFSPVFPSWCLTIKSQHCLHPISHRIPGAAAWHRDLGLPSPKQGSHLPLCTDPLLWSLRGQGPFWMQDPELFPLLPPRWECLFLLNAPAGMRCPADLGFGDKSVQVGAVL